MKSIKDKVHQPKDLAPHDEEVTCVMVWWCLNIPTTAWSALAQICLFIVRPWDWEAYSPEEWVPRSLMLDLHLLSDFYRKYPDTDNTSFPALSVSGCFSQEHILHHSSIKHSSKGWPWLPPPVPDNSTRYCLCQLFKCRLVLLKLKP